jgi:phage shock protein PspC (stress-responsive transcriptional regulator)/uncharacterized membrane protein
MNNSQKNAPTPPSAESRFFAWVRNSGVERPDQRWIAGVSSGIATRLGWDVVLIRVLMVASVLCFGFGLALYGIMWFVIPDRRNNTILLEELIAGRWDWSCVGVFLCIGVTLMLPGAGFVVVAVACLALFVLMQWSRNNAGSYDSSPMSSTPPASPASVSPQASQSSQTTQTPPASTPYTPKPASATPPMWNSPAYSTSGPQQTAYAQPYAQPYSQPYTGMGKQYHPRTIFARRQSAGPIVVSAIVGVLLLSAAAMLISTVRGDYNIAQALKIAAIWSCASTVLLGLVIVLLGCMGRRSGGLIPFALISLILTAVLASISGAYGYAMSSSDYNTRGFEHVSVASDVTMGSTPSDVQRYTKGLILDGSDNKRNDRTENRRNVSSSVATIDLSAYQRNNGTHTLTKVDGTTVKSGCPTGAVRLVVIETVAKVVMPKDCTYSISNNGGVMNSPSSIGGTFARVGGSGSLSLEQWFHAEDDGESTSAANDLDNPEINIDVSAMVNGELSVVYAQ